MVAERKTEEQFPGGVIVDYWPLGGARELWQAKDRQILIEGPAGTGKTVGCLQKIHRAATKYAGMRGLIIRKTQVSLSASALVTFKSKVLHRLDGTYFYGGSKDKPAAYIYPNGATIAVAGMDQSSKIMSTDFDFIFANEANELTEEDVEILDTRCRNGVMPYQQFVMDVNPQYPTHFLNQRCNAGKTRRILSRHEDNPLLYDPKTGEQTEFGASYIGRLDGLTGVRYLRLRKGVWVAADGQVYEGWQEDVHHVPRETISDVVDRVWCIDWGYTNPLVWSSYAIDWDGRLTLEHEFYRTKTLVEDAAEEIMRFWGNRRPPVEIICDHDAGDRATWEKHTGLTTKPAYKDVKRGVQMVESRLKVQADGKPRLRVMRDTLIHEPDQALKLAGRPTCTAEEFPTYVWEPDRGIRRGEVPKKEDDHGMDNVRYAVASQDASSWRFEDHEDTITDSLRELGLI